MALCKKSGGVRPIAIGFSLRRLVSKYANQFRSIRLKSYFHPHQVGVGIPGGCDCEAAIHSAHRFLEGMSADYVMVKLVFAIAFNGLHAMIMLLSVFNRLPELYAYCRLRL